MGLGELYLDQQRKIAFRTVTQAAIFNCDMIDQICITRPHALKGLSLNSWKRVQAYTNPEIGKEFQSLDSGINTLDHAFVSFRRKRMMICARLALWEFEFWQIRVLVSCFNCATGQFMVAPSRCDFPFDIAFVRKIAAYTELYDSSCLLKDLGEMGVAMSTEKGTQ